MPLVKVATCALDQWALDFDGNLERITESIRQAKAYGAKYRVGPELEVTGYGCEDHFSEMDTFLHAWDSIATILSGDLTDDILCDVGMPVLHRGVRYNCRLFLYNRKILLIRPKTALADDGNYRESRWFTAYRPGVAGTSEISSGKLAAIGVLAGAGTGASGTNTAAGATSAGAGATASSSSAASGASGGLVMINSMSVHGNLELHELPACVRDLTGQTHVPFGVGVIETRDGVTIASETCEELFTPRSLHIDLSLDGVDIISNGSGSHHQLRKLHTRVDLMRGATTKGGGVYLYANQQGCDGGRLYYDGCAIILVNGEAVAQGTQFSLRDVEVIVATVELDDVRSYRSSIASRGIQASNTPAFPRVYVDFTMALSPPASLQCFPSSARPVTYLRPEEEIGLGPACWLWDYLRRSGMGGFFLPLSGGADSAATCTIVGIMCNLVFDMLQAKDTRVRADLLRMVGEAPDSAWNPANPREIANRLMHTCYMGTTNSSKATRERAERVADQVGAYHINATIDSMVTAVVSVFLAMFGVSYTPKFLSQGGTSVEDLALQNVQARLRMVLSYFLAILLPWVRRGAKARGLLVLGSANVDEALRGYLTKYDCSSADINPIGAVSKTDLKRFLIYASDAYHYPALRDIVGAPPTAELRPPTFDAEGHEVMQLDEVDMGMTYEELTLYGRLRKTARCGPFTMYQHLVGEWHGRYTPRQVADKVKFFYRAYAINRHKLTVLTPSYHAESYSPDDNRYDLRPFLYPVSFSRQFAAIDADVAARDSIMALPAESGPGTVSMMAPPPRTITQTERDNPTIHGSSVLALAAPASNTA